MPDDLDQVTEEPAVEPSAEPVVDPTPEPEPVAEPAPESNYQPTFLDDAGEPAPQAAPQPQWTPEQIAAVNAQRAYQQQQQMQMPQTEEMLNRFIQNPNDTIDGRAAQMAQQVAGSMMAQQIAPVNEFITGQTAYIAEQAEHTIRDMYSNNFNKDETFASSDAVKKAVDITVDGLYRAAVDMARRGNPRGFAQFSNPKFAEAALALAKVMSGAKPGPTGSAPVPHTETTAPSATPTSGVKLTADQKEVLRKYNMNEDEYIKTLEAEASHDDFD